MRISFLCMLRPMCMFTIPSISHILPHQHKVVPMFAGGEVLINIPPQLWRPEAIRIGCNNFQECPRGIKFLPKHDLVPSASQSSHQILQIHSSSEIEVDILLHGQNITTHIRHRILSFLACVVRLCGWRSMNDVHLHHWFQWSRKSSIIWHIWHQLYLRQTSSHDVSMLQAEIEAGLAVCLVAFLVLISIPPRRKAWLGDVVRMIYGNISMPV